jgi:hypothetical protein
MDWSAVLFSFITIGVLIDLFAIILRFGDHFGLTKPTSPAAQGMPIGPIFYLLGFAQLLLIDKKPWGFALLVLLCCTVFYVLIIFSGMFVDGCVKLVRRLRACHRKVFYSNLFEKASAKNAVELALEYMIGGQRTSEQGVSLQTNSYSSGGNQKIIGFIYLKCLQSHWGGYAEICMLSSGKSLINVIEDAPGQIREVWFAKNMAKCGFPMDHWQIDKRKRIVVPSKDYSQIPQFINSLFKGYYGWCGNDHRIRVEVLQMAE